VQSQLQDLVDSIQRCGLVEPPTVLEQFATQETLYQRGGHERRRFRRYSLISNVIVVPLDQRLRPLGDPFVALSSGMSIDGIRLIHTDPSPSDHLFFEIEGQPVRFVLSVLRSRPVGPCFEIAGRLLNATVVNREVESPAVATVRCNATEQADARAVDEFPPTFDEFVHWAGVSAAVRLLKADLDARSGHGCSRL
jgi:hypothetical protein